MRHLHAAVLCTALAATVAFDAVPARADILLAVTRTTAAVYGGATYTVDFNGSAAGGTVQTFTTSAPTRVILMFNAECAVEGATGNWLDVDILVDPAGATGETAAAPSNGDNAFCSGNGTTTAGSGSFDLDGWVSAATIATIYLPTAGTHQVRVRVNNGMHSTLSRLDDMSLVVFR